MIKKYLFLIIMFGLFSMGSKTYAEIAYNFKFNGIDGKQINLADYENKVLVVVNVASRCGFTPQYSDLQKVWEDYKDKNVVIIGVPTNNFKQEPGSNKEIKDFCETNFNINFPMTEKIDVLGKNANFHKIIVGKDGKVANTFSSITKPSSEKFRKAIEKLI